MNTNNWQIALPITGLKTNIAPLKIGPIMIIRLKLELFPGSTTKNSGGLAIAINSEGKFSHESELDVIEFLEDALGILRVFVAKRMNNGLPALNIITKRKLWTYSEVYSLNIDSPKDSEVTPLSPAGRGYDYRLTEEHLAEFEANHISELLYTLFKLHKKEPVDELDLLITKSATWCGLMLEDVFYRDRFLRGVTALEALIEKSTMQGIGNKFRTLGSKLYNAAKSQPDIETVKEDLKLIYGARCNISHGGQFAGNEFGVSLGEFEYLITQICYSAIQLWKRSSSIVDFYGKIV